MKSTESMSITEAFSAHFPQISGQLDAGQLARLLDGASLQEVAIGRTVIRDRMPVDSLYFVLDGELGVYVEHAGTSKRLATIQPGEWMGEISVLSGEMLASATIITDVPCIFVKIHHIAFEKLISEDEAIAKVLLENLIELMAKRLRATAIN